MGYGEVDEVVKQTSKGGKFMRIDEDKQYQFRIVSKPKYKIRHYMGKGAKPAYQDCGGDDCQWCGKQVAKENRLDKDAQWAWIVIDREDGQVKVFQGTNAVARRIRDLAEIVDVAKEPINGDPRTWDVMFKKFKGTNGFTDYSIEPHPKKRGELTAEEQAAVQTANIDLETVMKGGKDSQHLGNYDGQQRSLETAPEDDVKPSDIPDNLGEDEDVDAEDIPF